MHSGELDFIVCTISELEYRKGVINSMRADWLKSAIVKDKEYDTYIENLEAAYQYCDFAVATLRAVVDVAKKSMAEKEN